MWPVAAQNRYIGIESLTEEELDALRARCVRRAPLDDLEAAACAAEAVVERYQQLKRRGVL